VADSTAEENQNHDFEEVAFDIVAEVQSAPVLISISNIEVEDGELLSQAGGQKVVLTGAFPPNIPLEVFWGPTGTANDAPAYGGQGFGYRPQSLDGLHLLFITPLLTPYKGPVQVLVRIP
jgi:hypothetical protein